jgi:uncharacterized protein (DUF433 family)
MVLPDFLTRDPDGFVHMTGHRIGLHHLIRAYNEGYSPEMLLGEFPTLSLALIHKVIAFYLEKQPEMDLYIAAEEQASESERAAAAPGPTVQELRQRLRKLRAS